MNRAQIERPVTNSSRSMRPLPLTSNWQKRRSGGEAVRSVKVKPTRRTSEQATEREVLEEGIFVDPFGLVLFRQILISHQRRSLKCGWCLYPPGSFENV
jgi:hypothetical protein